MATEHGFSDSESEIDEATAAIGNRYFFYESGFDCVMSRHQKRVCARTTPATAWVHGRV